MAVNINTVYQKVLAILNKEQRGYVTAQEFNLFANQAQLDIFEQYFYDINQFGRVPGNSTAFSDMLNILDEKISIFKKSATPPSRTGNFFDKPVDLYRLGTVVYNNTTTNNFGTTATEQIEAERINGNELLYINSSPLTKPSNTRPIFTTSSQGIRVYGDAEITTLSDIEFQYIKTPTAPQWAYQIVFDEPLYDATNSTNFELHESDETELVTKILELAGLLIKDIRIYQVEDQEEKETIQQEKS